MSEFEQSLLHCKVVFVGESGVGKTSIITQYSKKTFSSVLVSTSGASFTSKELIIREKMQTIKFELWDTAGQEQYRCIVRIFYKNAVFVILTYDITRRITFEQLKDFWVNEIRKNTPPDIILAVIGNKCDNRELIEVSEKEGKEFAKSLNAIFKLTSAKTGQGIDELFEILGNKFLEPSYEVTGNSDTMEQISQTISMSRGENNQRIKVGCC